MTDGESERLQKVLARLGLASRREAEEWIRAGRLVVNGVVAALGTRVGPSDQVRLDGRPLRMRESGAAEVFLCHRSPGELLRESPSAGGAAAAESAGDETGVERGEDEPRTPLIARLPRRGGRRYIAISPMPRVDGGLEVVTSDGALAEALQRAVRGLRAEFTVRIRGELSEQQVQGVLGGELDRGERLAVETVEPGGGEGANRWYTLVTRGASGKDVRQLFERQGALVSRILRTRLGSLALDRSLARGHFRRLERQEIEQLASSVGMGAGEEPAGSAEGRAQRAPRASDRERPIERRSESNRDARPRRDDGARPARGQGAQRSGGRRARDRGRGSGPRPSGRR